jgi:hypothetical protein
MKRSENSIMSGPLPLAKPGVPDPNLPKWMFWDLRYEELDWAESYLYVIERVLERGNDDEYTEMIRSYGMDRVIRALKSEIGYLPPYVIPRVCAYFGLRQEELRCHKRAACSISRRM